MKRLTLNARLLLMLTLGLALAWVMVGFWVQREAETSINALMDAHLSKSARLIAGVFLHEAVEHKEANTDLKGKELHEIENFVHEYEQDLLFWVWDEHQHLLLFSPMAEPVPADRANTAGFSDFHWQAKTYRGFVITDPGTGYRVMTAQPTKERLDLRSRIEHGARTGLLLGLPLFLLVVGLGVRSGLNPLYHLSARIAARSTEDRTPIPTADLPSELLPMATALNTLLDRLGQALDKERRFTADAAHELRTPMAALKIQAQVAAASEDPQARDHALRNIVQGVDRTTHLVSQLLTLARVDAPQPNTDTPHQASDGNWFSAMLGELSQTFPEQSQRIQVTGTVTAFAPQISSTLLSTLLRNLLDNALRYAPQGPITVEFRCDTEQHCVWVKDLGPGISETERDRVLGRFARGADAGSTCSGLGLSIVQRVVEQAGGQLRLDWTQQADGQPKQGLSVGACFANPNQV